MEECLLRAAARYGAAPLGAALLLAGVCLGGGCGGPDLAQFALPHCAPPGALALDEFTPSPVDYIELRVYDDYDPAATQRLLTTSGTPCSGALRMSACQSEFSTLRSGLGVRATCTEEGACTFYYLVTTHGDDVVKLETKAQFNAFLGPIRSPQLAAWAAWAAGYDLSCTDKSEGAVRSVDSGYEVIATRPAGCSDLTQYVLLINGGGGVAERSVRTLPSAQEGPCRSL